MNADVRKQYLSLGGKPLLVRTLEALASWPGFAGIVVALPPDDLAEAGNLISENQFCVPVETVAGGSTRQESVANGLRVLKNARDEDAVFIHDGVRPFPPVRCFDLLEKSCRPDGALAAIPCNDTLKREVDGKAASTVDRQNLWRAQTPQVFPLRTIRELIEWAAKENVNATDEASLAEKKGLSPRLVMGDSSNIKVTYGDDLGLAEHIYMNSCMNSGRGKPSMRIGHGYDVHRFCNGRKLILGGVEIPWSMGLLGHSDADVLAHAVADACLGAAGLGDIGRQFPDTDPALAGISSMKLLNRIAAMLKCENLRLVSADATVVAEKPKIAFAVSEMESNLCRAMHVSDGTIKVKATTTEGLGFEGRMEGVSAHAVALVEQFDAD